MDTAQWPQEIGLVKPMDSTTCSRPLLERRTRPQKEQALNCPRCNSTNTKFCYYNNYSLTQPRYFCKTCRRYWTEGGSLRNVPVGGGSRKNKRSLSSSSSSSQSSGSKKLPDLPPSNPKINDGHDLNLAFPTTQDYQNVTEFVENNNTTNPSPASAPSSSFSALELLRSGMSSRGLNSFMPMPMVNSNAVYPPGFVFHDIKPTLNFALDGLSGGYGNMEGAQEGGGGRLLFPFEDLRQVSSNEYEQNRGQGNSSGYWNGMLGGGSW